jgi:sensor histidine kinase YesM
MYGNRIFEDYRIALVSYPLIYGIGYFSWFSHFLYDHYLRTKFPSVKETRHRVVFKMLVNFFIMTPSILLIFYVFQWLDLFGYRIGGSDLLYGYLVGLSINIIFESLWEVIYIIEKFKEAAAEKEMIEQMQLQQEFNNLKQKVNPHFLFNSFNTLSSLISEDRDKAEKFLDELSKVYRYLLRNNESGMSTVEQETTFIASYSKLLETRFGEGFKMDMRIQPACKDKEIPSLTLQLLVENAVKHNIISRQQPVRVTITSTGDGYLHVENNLNKKIRKAAESTGIGLVNIREKYKLLNRFDMEVSETPDTFRVKIPLIS